MVENKKMIISFTQIQYGIWSLLRKLVVASNAKVKLTLEGRCLKDFVREVGSVNDDYTTENYEYMYDSSGYIIRHGLSKYLIDAAYDASENYEVTHFSVNTYDCGIDTPVYFKELESSFGDLTDTYAETLKKAGVSIENFQMWSPKEYNFETDSLDLRFTSEVVDMLQDKELHKYLDLYMDVVRRRTSRDEGYISFEVSDKEKLSPDNVNSYTAYVFAVILRALDEGMISIEDFLQFSEDNGEYYRPNGMSMICDRCGGEIWSNEVYESYEEGLICEYCIEQENDEDEAHMEDQDDELKYHGKE